MTSLVRPLSLASQRSLLHLSSNGSRRSMGLWPKIRPVRIKVITMDVTGTIVSFRGTLEEHYVGAAEKSGIPSSQLQHKRFGASFNQAYKECCEMHPCFGGNIMSAKEWWRICVQRSFQLAGVEMDPHQQDVVFQRIYSTFGSHAAYESFQDAKPFLQWARRSGLVTGILSNADERYGDSILPMLGITLDEVQFHCFSKDYQIEKPHSQFFQAAIRAAVPWLLANQPTKFQKEQQLLLQPKGSSVVNLDAICAPSEVLHIGNDYEKDFEGARRAGMHCVLLDRYAEDEKAAEWKRRGAPVLKDLLDVVEFLGRSNCRLG
ncbi:Haloacid dehalogenase-like hydrolase [Seminavis robusta]|uniref:Haloacid dehalogenase-like hydrolase n=1 Tax=Seminavis robusta TaxID=568900 RepID=A0A9N8DS23_9STRA|nr:Haloacid dehalogenase-like hydrolase [Seminavis robusta]|eukprot:Sro312_g114480.1 Haloacid dehalogenase-like hydrolase (319) ;mRNA; f:9962-10918